MTSAATTAHRSIKQALVQQYRPIGSAAVAAAMLFTGRRK